MALTKEVTVRAHPNMNYGPTTLPLDAIPCIIGQMGQGYMHPTKQGCCLYSYLRQDFTTLAPFFETLQEALHERWALEITTFKPCRIFC